jgi:cellulose synthase/poly-beta-1,6-N-acetylglucosamine synthase-like glycosyltransferase
MLFLYIIGAIAIVQGIVSLRDGIHACRHIRTFRPRSTRCDSVIVFCPCKGVDHDFEKNIRSLLEQEYSNYTVTFVVESEDDDACAALTQMGIREILVAGRASDCGQKVHNLTYAVRRAGGSADIYVFCDSDARFHPRWLSTLIAPLDPANVTTGYRWYAVERFNIPTLLRSAWNASVVTALGDHDRNFTWGGSMAMRRSTFERLNILQVWRGSVSDDFAVTRAAERASTRIVFVPECLVPSYGECTWRELIEFTTRQVTITRVYHSRLWRMAFFGSAVFNVAFWGMLFVQPWMSLVLYILGAVKSWIRIRAVRSVVPVFALSGHDWFYILFSPAAALLYLYNMIRSAAGTDIVWRQIRYKLVSPNETRVVSSGGASAS